MKEDELVERLRKLYAKPIPENCRMARMNLIKASNRKKRKWKLSDRWMKHSKQDE